LVSAPSVQAKSIKATRATEQRTEQTGGRTFYLQCDSTGGISGLVSTIVADGIASAVATFTATDVANAIARAVRRRRNTRGGNGSNISEQNQGAKPGKGRLPRDSTGGISGLVSTIVADGIASAVATFTATDVASAIARAVRRRRNTRGGCGSSDSKGQGVEQIVGKVW
jgi:hypothetical protein